MRTGIHRRFLFRPLIGFYAVVLALAFGRAGMGAEPLVFRANLDSRDSILFTSKAPVEDFTGKAGAIRGEILIANPDDILGGKTAAKIEVDLNSLDTGLGLRDRHMRRKYLETDKYPMAVFTLEKVDAAESLSTTANGEEQAQQTRTLRPNTPTRLTVTGTFAIHGVQRRVQIPDMRVTYQPASPATAKLRPGDVLRVQAEFPIRLADYGIKRPQFMLLRIAEQVTVKVDMIFGTKVKGVSLLNADGIARKGGQP